MSRGRDQRDSARDYLIANPTATNADVARYLGISSRTVGYARSELMTEGRIPPAWGDHKSPFVKKKNTLNLVETATEGTPFDTQTTSDLNAAVANALSHESEEVPLGGDTLRGRVLDEFDTEEMEVSKLKRILWRIARTDLDNRIRTSAIWTLTRIQQDMDERSLGPGLPKTKSDIINRLLQLFDGVGAAIVIEAMQTYLDKRKGKQNAGQISSEPVPSTQSDSGTTPASGSSTDLLSDVSATGPINVG
jgi:hypothetical protein